MKKVYLSPDVRYVDVHADANFLVSAVVIGGTTGENLNDPVQEDPWS